MSLEILDFGSMGRRYGPFKIGGMGGGGGVALPPTPANNLYVNRGWYPKGIPAR